MKMPTWQWYPRKKPTLQIKILAEIALKGTLSKIGAQRKIGCEYSTIFDAFTELQKRKFITIVKKVTPNGYGTPEKFYKLTDKGIYAFISQVNKPEEFWMAMNSYCQLNSRKNTIGQFAKYYNYFESNYLGYSLETGYFFQSHFLDLLFDKWLVDNGLKDDRGEIEMEHFNFPYPISPSQKVLECLALNGLSTFKQLVNDVHSRERLKRYPGLEGPEHDVEWGDLSSCENIEEVLKEYTLSNKILQQMRSQEYMDRKMPVPNYIDFLTHTLIVEKDGVYELSLFGITVILYLTNYLPFIDKDTEGNSAIPSFFLFDWESNFIEEYNIIASNYHTKLPLVFGKWNVLKYVMAKSRMGSLTEVTRGLFNRDVRGKLITHPTAVGRFKEYYDNVQALAHKASVRLAEIYNELEKFRYADEDQSQYLFARKREEIWNILRFTTVDRFIQSLYDNEHEDPDVTEIVNKLESIYANEITFLFYLLIGRGPGKKKSNMFPDTWVSFDETMQDSQIEFDSSPSVELIDILKKDRDIKTQFTRWINDSMFYQTQVFDLMHNYNDRIDGSARTGNTKKR